MQITGVGPDYAGSLVTASLKVDYGDRARATVATNSKCGIRALRPHSRGLPMNSDRRFSIRQGAHLVGASRAIIAAMGPQQEVGLYSYVANTPSGARSIQSSGT